MQHCCHALQSGSLAGLVRRLLLLECTKLPACQPDTSSAAAATAGLNLFHPKLKHVWQQQQLLDLQQIALTCPGSSSSYACGSLTEWQEQWHPLLLNVLLWEVRDAGLNSVLLTELEQQLQMDSNATGCCTTQHRSSAAGSPLAADAADTAVFRSGSSSRLTNDFVESPDQQEVQLSKQHSKHGESRSSKNSKISSSSREHHKQTSASSSSSTAVSEDAAHAYVQSCMGLLSRAALSSWVVSWHSCMAEGGGDYGNSSKR
jgi:hypothetical protein